MTVEVIGHGMIGRAFSAAAPELLGAGDAVICASGVADSRSVDPSAFRREYELLRDVTTRARHRGAVVVYFSGAPVYGRQPLLRVESDSIRPETPYGRHKAECELLLARSGARYVVLRLPNVVGPRGHPAQLVPSLVAQVAAGEVTVQSGATRDLLDVGDVVAIVATLLRSDAGSGVFNVASGVSTPVERLVREIASILRVSPHIVMVPGGERQEFSIERIRNMLPTYPRFDADYPMQVLQRHVGEIERALSRAEAPGIAR